MIRTGEMTPFGTIMKLIDHEKLKAETKKHASSETPKEEQTATENDFHRDHVKKKHSNFFDEHSKRVYHTESDFSNVPSSRARYPKLGHHFEEDPELSGEEDFMDHDSFQSSGDEYVPDKEEMRDSYQDEGTEEDDLIEDLEEKEGISRTPSVRKRKTKKKAGFRKVKRPKYKETSEEESEDSAPDESSVFKAKKQRKTKDDGDESYFAKRQKEWKKSELLRKQLLLEDGVSEDEDGIEFDGGLKVPGQIWSKLYNYQRTGVRWLWELHCQEAGGIIGDEMGLGKTIQTIAFLAAMKESKLRSRSSRYVGLGPLIIVCPTTVMHQWLKEFHKWWPPFRVAILHSSGSYTSSEAELIRETVRHNGVLVTSYNSMVIHQENILKHDWHYAILDEGHKIRNPDAQITLACKQIRTPHRIILSGSPMQNNLKELWSLFDFVFPGKLGTLPDFMAHFSVPIVQGGYSNASQIQVQTAFKCACALRDTINPYLLRRMKADVKINLPNKSEQVLFCRLTREQTEVYKEYLDSKECQMILSGRFMVFPGLITLRKICNHPDLSTGGPKIFRHDMVDDSDESLEYGYWKRSGKMIVVQSLLKIWKKQGQRVLLFTQSRQMLDVLETFVQNQGYNYLRMDGGTAIGSRQPLVDYFNKDMSKFLFLLTTRVGGLGINLVGANRVLIFDPDWNPSTDIQARERAWRIGQQRQVTVYRLLTSGTIEEKIYHRQIFKQFLANRVLKDPKQRRFFKSNDLYELFTLGNEDHQEGTETSAIFAGTGSDVKVVAKKKEDKEKKNHFDEMKIKEEKKKQNNEEIKLNEKKLAKMRELARKLSRQIVSKRVNNMTSPETSINVNKGTEIIDDEKDDLYGKGQDEAMTSAIRESMKSDKNKGVTVSKGLEEGEVNGKKDRLTDYCKTKGKSEYSKEEQKHNQKQKRKKKHKKKDAVFEGKRVAHLVGMDTYQHGGDKATDTDHRQKDDYVLQRLFKKSGVHSVVQHDTIMMSSNPDYALVEGEAERVAREAVRALKQSRTRCLPAVAGVPTWTGQHGGAAGPSRPRFGQKKKGGLLPNLANGKDASVMKKTTDKEDSSLEAKHFDGKSSEADGSAGVLSSVQLLAKIKARNPVTSASLTNDSNLVNSQEVHDDDLALLEDVRTFIAFQCAVDGQGTTEEILQRFKNRLPPENSAKFKAMLRQICDFTRSNGIGVWSLKPEMR
ncbi:DNA excision repair protein ERCC-6-like [Lingula anatina]|uniref:DNA excision repair protein ERCC-6 n=1 Tax=Lingula anatina TaxID=7574 RepID=A0A1S3HHK7_LINAN|nr:DNA excision repair protein ERCC-6-like [Lingula anatina]|eukprot:XP_013385583.1 DNA excision repair protein ERCC-6-like [Lingula anatina]